MNEVSIKRKVGHFYGAGIIEFSDPVQFLHDSTSTVIWGSCIVPVDKLGTEYFVVFPSAENCVYTCAFYSIEVETVIIDYIQAINNISSQNISYRSLGVLDRIHIERNYDFTGSRILASKTIAVFSGIRYINRSIAFQLHPTQLFGSTFQTTPWYSQYNIRLIATAVGTTIRINGSSSFSTQFSGETFDLASTYDQQDTIVSDQPICVFLFHRTLDPTIYAIPVEQYSRNSYFKPDLAGRIGKLFVVPGIRTNNITISVSSPKGWNITSVETLTTHYSAEANAAVIDFNIPSSRYVYVQSELPIMSLLRIPAIRHIYAHPGAGRTLYLVKYFLTSLCAICRD